MPAPLDSALAVPSRCLAGMGRRDHYTANVPARQRLCRILTV